MTDSALIEAAARALFEGRRWNDSEWKEDTNEVTREWYREKAILVLAAVTPLIEAAALERAARVAAVWLSAGEIQLRAGEMTAQELRTTKAIARAIHDGIRALKEQP